MTTHTLDIGTALRVYSAEQIDAGAAAHHPEAAEILDWSRRFLTTAHPDLGRSGPVCPYTQPSLRRGLFHIAVADTGAGGDLPALVGELRAWYDRLLAGLAEESDRELLTVLLVLPGLDRADSTALDEAQRKAKDEFVEQGLMIGQFHPVCEEGACGTAPSGRCARPCRCWRCASSSSSTCPSSSTTRPTWPTTWPASPPRSPPASATSWSPA